MGLVLVWSLVLGLGTVLSGIFNIDSAISTALQITILASMLIFLLIAKRNAKVKEQLPTLITGLMIGSFIGFTFVASGVWHGVYPSSPWYPPLFYPSGQVSYQTGCPVIITQVTNNPLPATPESLIIITGIFISIILFMVYLLLRFRTHVTA